MRDRKKWMQFLVSNAISLGVGAASALLTAGSMKKYQVLRQPPLAPPGWVFPVVWSILFVCMGTAAWLIYRLRTGNGKRDGALRLYAVQLIMNALWPVVFFRFEAYWAAFIWLLLLWYLIFLTMLRFWRLDARAGKLLLPYFLWTAFAAYLNLGVAVLN